MDYQLAVAAIREAVPGAIAVYLFGSRARGDAGRDSDVDLSMHLVRKHRLGIPQDSRDAFDLLAGSGRLDAPLADSLKRMVGFRNVAEHDYTRLDLAIVRVIVEKQMEDLARFSSAAIRGASGA